MASLNQQTSKMNLDALFEDLEAQAYFHSKNHVFAELKTSKLVLVHRVPSDQGNLVLSSPLLGKDFIAGFVKRIQPVWMVIPAWGYSRIQSLDQGYQLSRAEIKFVELLEGKLCFSNLDLETKEGLLPEVQILSTFGSSIEICKSGKVSFLSVNFLTAVVVENLSGYQSSSAT
jgi:hypothetical protein